MCPPAWVASGNDTAPASAQCAQFWGATSKSASAGVCEAFINSSPKKRDMSRARWQRIRDGVASRHAFGVSNRCPTDARLYYVEAERDQFDRRSQFDIRLPNLSDRTVYLRNVDGKRGSASHCRSHDGRHVCSDFEYRVPVCRGTNRPTKGSWS